MFVCPPSEIDAQSPPAQREEGALWWNTEEGILYVWYEDADSSQWVITVPQGGGAGEVPPGTTVDITPPSPAVAGQLWWNSDQVENGGGRLYVYYDNAWVDTSVPGGKGSYLNESEAKGLFLSKTEDDTAAGAITFNGQTTHEAGVEVTGGTVNVTADKTGAARTFFGGGTIDTNTTDCRLFYSSPKFTGTGAIPFVTHFQAQPVRPTGSTTIAETTGFLAGSNLAGDNVSTAYGFYSGLDDNTKKNYNFYAGGTAPNYFAGKITATANLELAGTQGDLTENPANSNTIGSAVRADGVISCKYECS